MKVIILTICIVIFSCTIGVSQTDYAVTSKGDTLKGKVKIFTYDLLDRVQVAVDKKKKMFTCLEVRPVSIDKEIFHTVKYEQGYRFMKIIKPGFLSLYGFRLTNQMSYDGQFLVKKDGSSMEIPNLTFKRSMANFLGECKEVEERGLPVMGWRRRNAMRRAVSRRR